MSDLRYVTNVHGLTGEEPVEIRRYADFAVLQIGPINIFAENALAIRQFCDRLDVALDSYFAKAE